MNINYLHFMMGFSLGMMVMWSIFAYLEYWIKKQEDKDIGGKNRR